MPSTQTLLDPSFLKKLEALSLVSKRVFAGQTKGERRSLKRGSSIEFADFREYTLGDDLRYVDWKAYGRLEKLFLKLFVEEEDLSLHLLIDTSQSMDFGSPLTKADYARRVAAALGYIALSEYDRVLLSSFSQTLGERMPPLRGKPGIFPFFQFLETKAAYRGRDALRRCALPLRFPGQERRHRGRAVGLFRPDPRPGHQGPAVAPVSGGPDSRLGRGGSPSDSDG